MKNYEAEQMLYALNALSNSNMAMPTLTAFKILKDKNTLEHALGPYLEMKNNIILKYDKSGTVTDKNPNFKKCLKEINVIENEQIDEVKLENINLKDLKDTQISIKLLNTLMPIIDETEEKDAK